MKAQNTAFLWVSLLAAATWGQGLTKNLLSLPADVSYTDKKTGKVVVLKGELYFESWPIIENAKQGAISKDVLVPTKNNPALIVRGEDGKFVAKLMLGERRIDFDFDKIPVKLSDSKDISQSLERGFSPDVDRELDGVGTKGGKEPPPPPPVVLALDVKPTIDEILVSQIQQIQFKQPDKVNMEIGGRFLAYSQKFKGSGGAVQVSAATFFGGSGDDTFIGGGFLNDGTILGVCNVVDLGFAGGVSQAVLGKDPQKMPQTAPAGPVVGKARAPLDARNTVALVRYSADLKALREIVRLPWGSVWGYKMMSSPSGAIYLNGMALANFDLVRGAAGKVHVVPNPEALAKANELGRAPAEDSYLLRLSPDLKRIEWLVVFKHVGIEFGFQGGEKALVWCGPKRYMVVDPAGQVSDGPTIKDNIRENRWRFAVNPVDGSFYHGGDYQSGTGFEPYRNPWLHRIDPNGKCRWTAWNWSGPMVGTYFRQVSDSSVVKVNFCRNGDLMVIGWSDGGNTVLANPPYDLERTHGRYGALHDMSAAGVGSFAHLLRMDAKTMEVKCGTMWISYLPYAEKNGKPNSARATDVIELEDGRWALAGGTAFATIETPDAWIRAFILDYNEDPTKARPKAGPCFAMLDPDMRELIFCSLTPGVKGQHLYTRGNEVLLVGTVEPRDTSYGKDLTPILSSPVQKDYGGGATDGYLMLINTAARK
jgi:hypothetical protein